MSAPDIRLKRGAEAFDRRDFFMAHEIWEELWNDVIGAEKDFVQALVQIAAAYVKVDAGQPSGGIKLLERGLSRLAAVKLRAGSGFEAAVRADLQRLRSAVGPIAVTDLHPPCAAEFVASAQ